MYRTVYTGSTGRTVLECKHTARGLVKTMPKISRRHSEMNIVLSLGGVTKILHKVELVFINYYRI